MPKKFIKKIMPDHEMIRNHHSLRCFGKLLHDPKLWHLNRHTAPGAFAVGLFMAFVPVPLQMLLAAGAAILFRVNLPLSVVLVWITNPVTMGPIFYFAYQLGSLLLGHETIPIEFEFTHEWLAKEIGHIWQPFILGCSVLAGTASAIGYSTIRGLWYWRILCRIKRKHHSRLVKHP